MDDEQRQDGSSTKWHDVGEQFPEAEPQHFTLSCNTFETDDEMCIEYERSDGTTKTLCVKKATLEPTGRGR